ncbi:MAG: preprotein translocase subunit SecG [Erysipelotrichaceae bacterium]|nr:preprotein translocase subunit SecG [Erysipelotrichaceae bacterium]
MHWLDVLLLIVAAWIVILTLLQGGKSEGASGAFTGGSGLNVFSNSKERGPELFFSRLTLTLGIVFFVLVLLVRLYVK